MSISASYFILSLHLSPIYFSAPTSPLSQLLSYFSPPFCCHFTSLSSLLFLSTFLPPFHLSLFSPISLHPPAATSPLSLLSYFSPPSCRHLTSLSSVGFIGYPNVGKSSVINTLRKKKVCSVAPIAGQTKVCLCACMYMYVLLQISLPSSPPPSLPPSLPSSLPSSLPPPSLLPPQVWQYITFMRRIYLIDCPGVVYPTRDTDTQIVLKGVVS